MTQLTITFDPPASTNPNNVTHNRATTTQNVTQTLARAWVKYAHANKLNPKTKLYKQQHHAFLAGIGNALGEEMPVLLSMCLASGRDVSSIIERTQPR